jgi:hypothetical protein
MEKWKIFCYSSMYAIIVINSILMGTKILLPARKKSCVYGKHQQKNTLFTLECWKKKIILRICINRPLSIFHCLLIYRRGNGCGWILRDGDESSPIIISEWKNRPLTSIAHSWNSKNSLILSFFATQPISHFVWIFIYFCYFITINFHNLSLSSSRKRHEAKWILKPIRDIFNLSYDTRGRFGIVGAVFFGKIDKKYFSKEFSFLFFFFTLICKYLICKYFLEMDLYHFYFACL